MDIPWSVVGREGVQTVWDNVDNVHAIVDDVLVPVVVGERVVNFVISFIFVTFELELLSSGIVTQLSCNSLTHNEL